MAMMRTWTQVMLPLLICCVFWLQRLSIDIYEHIKNIRTCTETFEDIRLYNHQHEHIQTSMNKFDNLGTC